MSKSGRGGMSKRGGATLISGLVAMAVAIGMADGAVAEERHELTFRQAAYGHPQSIFHFKNPSIVIDGKRKPAEAAVTATPQAAAAVPSPVVAPVSGPAESVAAAATPPVSPPVEQPPIPRAAPLPKVTKVGELPPAAMAVIESTSHDMDGPPAPAVVPPVVPVAQHGGQATGATVEGGAAGGGGEAASAVVETKVAESADGDMVGGVWGGARLLGELGMMGAIAWLAWKRRRKEAARGTPADDMATGQTPASPAWMMTREGNVARIRPAVTMAAGQAPVWMTSGAHRAAVAAAGRRVAAAG